VLIVLLARVTFQPGTGVVAAPELGLRGKMSPAIVRERSGWYAKKYLGRLLGRIPDPSPLDRAPPSGS